MSSLASATVYKKWVLCFFQEEGRILGCVSHLWKVLPALGLNKKKAWYIYIFFVVLLERFFFSVSGNMDHSPVVSPQNLCCYKLGHKKPGILQSDPVLPGAGLKTHTSQQLTYTIIVSAGLRTARGRNVRCFKYNVCIIVLVLVQYFLLSNIFGR